MATVNETITGVKPVTSADDGSGDSASITWVLTTADFVGRAVKYNDFADRTVQFFGTFGAATVVLEGSLDGGTTWATLTDPQGNAISKTAAALEAVQEAVPLVRPQLSVVGTGATVTVVLFVRKAS